MLITKSIIWNLYALAYNSITESTSYCRLINSIVDYLDLKPGNKILDLGCGNGNLEVEIVKRNLEDIKITAVDISPQMLKRAKAKLKGNKKIEWVQMDIRQGLNFPATSFDRIVLLHSLYTLPAPEEVLKNSARLLRKGGLLVLAEPRAQAKLFPVIKENFQEEGLVTAFFKIFLNLPSFFWIMLINQIFLKKEIKKSRAKLSEEQILPELEKNRLTIKKKTTAYAGQDLVIVAQKI